MSSGLNTQYPVPKPATEPQSTSSAQGNGFSEDRSLIYFGVPIYLFRPLPALICQRIYPTGWLPQESGQMEPQRATSEGQVKIESGAEITFNERPKSPKKPCSQNLYRNAMQNLIRLTLSFLVSEAKSQQLLRRGFPELEDETIREFYKYVRRLRDNSCRGYISQGKLKNLMGLQPPRYFGSRQVRKMSSNEALYKKIMRTLAWHYLNHTLAGAILCSRKMQKELRQVHLARRNRLISILRTTEFQN